MDFDGISMDFDGILMHQHSMEMRFLRTQAATVVTW